jgi:hypothetical protein
MLKKLLFSIITLIPVVAVGQTNNNTGIPIPMKDHKVWYEKSYTLTNSKKANLYNNGLKWFKAAFPYPGKSIELTNEQAGEIKGTGIFKIVINNTGTYYWIRLKVTIDVTDSGYSVKATDFYEKPIKKGISNEYSKIEYRWWDFRQGKPWSAEDQGLFIGLDSTATSMMASLQKVMAK